jgi:hypothetical protein
VFKKRREIMATQKKFLADVTFGWAYSLRSVYHRHSARTALVVTIICVAYFSLAFFVAEWHTRVRVTCERRTPQDPIKVETFPMVDSVYLSVITMTTCGYGDLFPTTPLGRFFSCACAATGVVLLLPLCAGWSCPIRKFPFRVGALVKNTFEKNEMRPLLSSNTLGEPNSKREFIVTSALSSCFSY